MDGMIDLTEWKTPCCSVWPKDYREEDYPYDSGKKCPKCGKRWSELQIAREEHLRKTQPPPPKKERE